MNANLDGSYHVKFDDGDVDPNVKDCTYGPMQDWDMSLVTDLSWLFENKAVSADLSNWDVSRVTTMKHSALIINFNPFFILYLFFLV